MPRPLKARRIGLSQRALKINTKINTAFKPPRRKIDALDNDDNLFFDAEIPTCSTYKYQAPSKKENFVRTSVSLKYILF